MSLTIQRSGCSSRRPVTFVTGYGIPSQVIEQRPSSVRARSASMVTLPCGGVAGARRQADDHRLLHRAPSRSAGTGRRPCARPAASPCSRVSSIGNASAWNSRRTRASGPGSSIVPTQSTGRLPTVVRDVQVDPPPLPLQRAADVVDRVGEVAVLHRHVAAVDPPGRTRTGAPGPRAATTRRARLTWPLGLKSSHSSAYSGGVRAFRRSSRSRSSTLTSRSSTRRPVRPSSADLPLGAHGRLAVAPLGPLDGDRAVPGIDDRPTRRSAGRAASGTPRSPTAAAPVAA